MKGSTSTSWQRQMPITAAVEPARRFGGLRVHSRTSSCGSPRYCFSLHHLPRPFYFFPKHKFMAFPTCFPTPFSQRYRPFISSFLLLLLLLPSPFLDGFFFPSSTSSLDGLLFYPSHTRGGQPSLLFFFLVPFSRSGRCAREFKTTESFNDRLSLRDCPQRDPRVSSGKGPS